MKKKTILNILMVIFILIALGSGGYLAYYYYISSKTENDFEQLRDLIVEPTLNDEENPSQDEIEYVDVDGVKIQKKFEHLYRENKDFIGWIKVEDTNIDYPVMYTPNDAENGEFYIHRDFKMKYSAAGLPFVDSNCCIVPATDNVIIYGHNMNSGKMFHDLMQYEDESFYNAHKTFEFDTIYEEGTYEVVAVIRAQILPEESTAFKYYEFVNAGSKEEFLSYVDNIKKMSVIDTDCNVVYGDKLVTLSTCAYHVKDGRFAVIGKKIEE